MIFNRVLPPPNVPNSPPKSENLQEALVLFYSFMTQCSQCTLTSTTKGYQSFLTVDHPWQLSTPPCNSGQHIKGNIPPPGIDQILQINAYLIRVHALSVKCSLMVKNKRKPSENFDSTIYFIIFAIPLALRVVAGR